LLEKELREAGFGFSAKFTVVRKKARIIYKFSYAGKRKLHVRDSLRVESEGNSIQVFSKKTKSRLYLHGHKEPVFLPTDTSGLRYLIAIIFLDEKKPDFAKEALKYTGHLSDLFVQLFGVRYYAVQNQPALGLAYRKDFEEWKEKSTPADPSTEFCYQYYDFYKNRRKDFEEYLSIMKSLKLVDDIKLFELEPSLPDKKLRTLISWGFVVKGGTIWFNMLSDGTKRLIRLLFQVFYDKPSLVLIEEPESSIHWALQGKLLSVLQEYSDNRRILFSTHSEQVLNHLGPEHLIYLYNEEGKTKTKYVTQKQIARIHKFLTDIGPLGEYVTSGAIEEVLDG